MPKMPDYGESLVYDDGTVLPRSEPDRVPDPEPLKVTRDMIPAFPDEFGSHGQEAEAG